MKIKLTYSLVLFNQTSSEVEKSVLNILDTVPDEVQDYEIYLINNSPKNRGLSLFLIDLDKRYSRITLITPETNNGFGAGHNLAIRRLTSDYHLIVNPDVTIPSSKDILQLISIAVKNNAVVVAPKVVYPNGDLQPLVKKTPTVFDMMIRFLGPKVFRKRQRWFANLDIGYDKEFVSDNLPGSFLLFNTKVLQEINGFDERYFLYMEDSDITRAMAQQGLTLFTPKSEIIHELQRNNRKKIKGELQMMISMYKYFNKWGWKFW